MNDSHEIVVNLATLREVTLLTNLLELYAHDISDAFALDLGSDGRFGYKDLGLYWSEPGRRYPFLIRQAQQVLGFTLITRQASVSAGNENLDVAEFFVLRRHRRLGVGRRAAFLVWNRFSAHWTVRVSLGNRTGLDFWESVIAEYTCGMQRVTTVPGNPHGWRVFSFDTTAP
jgi:predicted acetyltransferase